MRKKITKKEYYQLEGLKYLADKKDAELREIVRAVDDLISENSTDNFGHSGDFVYGASEATAIEFLKKLKIEVI